MKKRAFNIFDTETTKKNGLAFDAAWRTITPEGLVLGTGSYLIKEATSYDNFWFTEKMAQYYNMAYRGMIRPVSMRLLKRIYRTHIEQLRLAGYEVVFCAYNAKFDYAALDNTSKRFDKNNPFWAEMPEILLMDLWYAWVKDCPDDYGHKCQWTDWINAKGQLKKKVNPKSSAEAVYRYITGQADFAEKHIAASDTLIEQDILMDILERGKELPIVKTPEEIFSMPTRLLSERFGHLAPPKPEGWEQMETAEIQFDIEPNPTYIGDYYPHIE